jgi:hypothetical protein
MIIKLLINAHANPTICDRFGRKPSGWNYIFHSIFFFLCLFVEVCMSNNLIRTILLKAEIKLEEKRQYVDQSDDSLDEEDYQDDSQVLFMPIPQGQHM